MVRVCQLCKRTSYLHPDLTFHSIPANKEERKIWFALLDFSAKTILPKRAEICSEHFTESDFITRINGAKCLKRGATPLQVDPKNLSCTSPTSDSDSDSSIVDSISPSKKKMTFSQDSLSGPSTSSIPLENHFVETQSMPQGVCLLPLQFAPQDILVTTNGLVFVKTGAIPVLLKIPKHNSEILRDETNSISSTDTASETKLHLADSDDSSKGISNTKRISEDNGVGNNRCSFIVKENVIQNATSCHSYVPSGNILINPTIPVLNDGRVAVLPNISEHNPVILGDKVDSGSSTDTASETKLLENKDDSSEDIIITRRLSTDTISETKSTQSQETDNSSANMVSIPQSFEDFRLEDMNFPILARKFYELATDTVIAQRKTIKVLQGTKRRLNAQFARLKKQLKHLSHIESYTSENAEQ